MKTKLQISLIFSLLFLFVFASLALAETSCIRKRQKVVNGRVNLLRAFKTVDGECPKGYTELSASVGIQGQVGPEGPQGPVGPMGPAGVSDVRVDDSEKGTVIPACTSVPVPPYTCFIPSILALDATCPSDTLVIKHWCVTKITSGALTASEGEVSEDGKSVQCGWINNSKTPVVGEFYARAVCLPLPSL